jgi:hypothetical protein
VNVYLPNKFRYSVSVLRNILVNFIE